MDKQAKLSISLNDGTRVVLLDMLSAKEDIPSNDIEHNVYCIESDGTLRWQVSGRVPIRSRNPFTNIWLTEDGELKAYSFDGVQYLVDRNTGKLTPEAFIK